MLAIISPQMFTDFCWPLDDIKSHDQLHNNYLNETETSGSGLGSPLLKQPKLVGNNEYIEHNMMDSNNYPKGVITVKKLNHNASERDRRKRINELYSSLRSLLPATEHKKKLSIPAMIARVVKYIPELQEEVERMVQKKESLNIKMGRNEEEKESYGYCCNQRKNLAENQSCSLSASRLGDRDVLIQISMLKTFEGSVSEALLNLEHEGLLLLNMSSFESFQGRVFYNLHLQALHTTQFMDLERLREKLFNGNVLH